MDSPTEPPSLSEQLTAVCDVWFNRQTSKASDAVSAYTVLLETLNAFKLSAPQITNSLAPRLGLTRSGTIIDAQDLGRLVMQRMMSLQEGNAPGHYEVDNALRCTLDIAQHGDLISDVSEQQAKDAIQTPIAHLQESVA